jgi:hypothetical protein
LVTKGREAGDAVTMISIAGHELVGHRAVGRLAPANMVDLWLKCTSRVVKYGFVVEYRDLEAPRTGIFDGLRITIDPDIDFEMQCFILLHLFGHSVQWVSPELHPQLDELQHTSDRELFMRALREYEFEAARFGRQLLGEAGLTSLSQWYSDFVETDWRYVERYYRTGQIPPWHECIASDCPAVEPKPIPRLEHKQVKVRFAF